MTLLKIQNYTPIPSKRKIELKSNKKGISIKLEI